MPLQCPSHMPFFIPTHLDRIVYSLYNDLNLHAKIDGNGPIFMKLRLGEVWCRDDVFRGQHSTSGSFINISLLSTYYAYNCSAWYYVSSYESIGWYDTGIPFNSNKQYGGTSAAALLSWLGVGCDKDDVVLVCVQLWRERATYRLLRLLLSWYIST